MITQRVHQLRKLSLEAENVLHHERAQLVTKFYKDMLDPSDPVPVQRAKCFQYMLDNKKLYIGIDELIIGERGPEPKATPTYPEISLHSLEDLEILHNRPKVFFKVPEETRNIYKHEIIPFWKGRTNRDKLMALMSQEWLKAYQAGIFTEFQEQRAPGHTVLGYKLFGKGMFDLIGECDQALQLLDAEINEIATHQKPIDDHTRKAIEAETTGETGSTQNSFLEDDRIIEYHSKRNELQAMKIAARALISFAERNSNALQELADHEDDQRRRTELLTMAAVCRRVPANAPQTFHEALQHYWFIHLGVITELNPWDSFNPGRLDQHLMPFYEKGIQDGSLDKERAKELLHCFWIKFNNHPAPPKMGVTAQESNTYTDFCLINLGGVRPDGSDAINDMTYILLEVIQEMRLLQPSSMVQVSKKNPDLFIHKTLDITRTGFGQPSIFNTDAIIQELLRQGKSLDDARNGGASGCVEAGAFGTEAYILTGYFNLAKILEVTLNNGYDNRTYTQIGPKTGDPATFNSFEELMRAYEKQIKHFVDIKIEGNNRIEKLYATELPAPFLSLLIEDCIANGKDYNAGGARYNTSYIQGVGLGSVTDSLTAIKYHVYDNRTISITGMMVALQNNFGNYGEFREELVYNTPKYGNDDDYADKQAIEVFNMYFNAVDGRPCYRGGSIRINMLPTTCHIYFGSVTGALPDGRLAGKPLSEGISPVQGADIKGPTAVMKSASKIDHIKTGGTLLNQKFTPSFFDDPESYKKLTALIRGYFRLDGHHIQFNVVSADTLRDAQKHPEKYRDLIVRVAGYSDYFNDLGEDLQEEIIHRTEHHR
jgi:trans-4-hydroxy-L-proline dehydratase